MVPAQRSGPLALGQAFADGEIARAAATAQEQGRLYTASVLGAAAGLLADVYAAAERHGVTPAAFASARLPARCLSAVEGTVRATCPATALDMRRLLDAVEDRLQALQVLTFRRGPFGSVVLPRLPVTPAWGRDGGAGLRITICSCHGWEFTLDRPHSWELLVVAQFDAGGAAAVADLALAVVRGERRVPYTEVTP